MTPEKAARLLAQLQAACPLSDFATQGNSVRWAPADGSTPEQVAAGQALVDGFPMADAIAQKRAAINAERVRREQGGFAFNGKTFDSDQNAYNRISAAAQTALTTMVAQQPFPTVTWTCADNTTMDLDAAGVVAMQAALVAHGLVLHGKAQARKTALAACATLEDVEAFDPLTGWDS